MQAAEQAQATLDGAERAKVALSSDIENLTRRKTELQASVKGLEAKLGGYKADLAVKENEKRAALASLDEQIAEKEKTLAKATAGYEQFRAAHQLG